MSQARLAVVAAVLLALAAPAPATGSPPTAAPNTASAQVEQLLTEQSAAWSRGDLETFVAGYAEDAVFVTPSGVTSGRDEVLARYRRRYPDRKAMGRLTLELLDVRVLAPASGEAAGASVVARWILEGMGEDGTGRAEGHTVIVLEKRAESWRIVHDASM